MVYSLWFIVTIQALAWIMLANGIDEALPLYQQGMEGATVHFTLQEKCLLGTPSNGLPPKRLEAVDC